MIHNETAEWSKCPSATFIKLCKERMRKWNSQNIFLSNTLAASLRQHAIIFQTQQIVHQSNFDADAYKRQYAVSSSAQVMACRLLGTMIFSDAMSIHWQFDAWEET